MRAPKESSLASHDPLALPPKWWSQDAPSTVSQLGYHIYPSQGVGEDLSMWSHFLQHWNGKSFFMEDYYKDAPDLSLYTDASGGTWYGSYFQGHWFRGDWALSQKFTTNSDTSAVTHQLLTRSYSQLSQWLLFRAVHSPRSIFCFIMIMRPLSLQLIKVCLGVP